jgi:deazaflavin-dependent oxidoreductase (nitroreductase family)
MSLDAALGEEQYCYLTTTGRVSGNDHTIEIWFALVQDGGRDTLYLMAGGRDRSDWVRNLSADPVARVRIADHHFTVRARFIEGAAEDPTARRLLYERYNPGYERDLGEWRDSSLPVALDVEREIEGRSATAAG